VSQLELVEDVGPPDRVAVVVTDLVASSFRSGALCAEQVDRFVALGGAWPPILVGRADGVVIDGAHRVSAARRFRPLRHPDPSASVSDRLVGVFRQLFDPFVEHPRMLEAAVRVQQRAVGTSDVFGGANVVGPFLRECFGEDTDPAEVAEVMLLLGHIAFSVVSQVAMGTMTADQVLSVFETAARRLAATLTTPTRPSRRRR
jgi:hypothetical protein